MYVDMGVGVGVGVGVDGDMGWHVCVSNNSTRATGENGQLIPFLLSTDECKRSCQSGPRSMQSGP